MKARIPPKKPTMPLEQQREKGKALIEKLRKEGLSDEDIARKIGVPVEMMPRFIKHIGL